MFLCQISRNTTIVPVSICLKVTAVQGAEPTQNYTSDFNGSDMPTDIRATQQRKGWGGRGASILNAQSHSCTGKVSLGCLMSKCQRKQQNCISFGFDSNTESIHENSCVQIQN